MRIPIGNETLVIDLPDDFKVEQNADGSNFAYVPRKRFAEVYFSVLTITPPTPTETDLGYDGIIIQASQSGMQAAIIGDKSVHKTERTSIRPGGKRRIHQWYVGYRNFAVVITVTILAESFDDPTSERILALVPETIGSIREHDQDA